MSQTKGTPLSSQIITLEALLQKANARIEQLESAIDECMVVCHIGVFNPGDDPKEALNKIGCYEQGIGAYFALENAADIASKALRKAWQLGQTYWAQADSESWSQNAKADKTQALYLQLIDETRAAIANAAQRE